MPTDWEPWPGKRRARVEAGAGVSELMEIV
jgi:hypothetical protein